MPTVLYSVHWDFLYEGLYTIKQVAIILSGLLYPNSVSFGPKHALELTAQPLKGKKALSGLYYFWNSCQQASRIYSEKCLLNL